jgi:predicted transcriptional regulator
MSFRSLNINFQSVDELFKEVDESLNGVKQSVNQKDTITFDSPKSFWKTFTNNKLEILVAISKFSPDSVYALAKILKREPHHVLKDCKDLQVLEMVQLKTTAEGRKKVKTMLSFNYDFIKVESELQEVLPISQSAGQYLLDAV